MLVDTSITIAVKNCMAQYDMRKIDVFTLKYISLYFNDLYAECVCSKEIHLKIKCPICGEYHKYEYKIKNLTKGIICIGGCENIGSPIVFLGKSNKVEEKINKYKEVNKKIYVML